MGPQKNSRRKFLSTSVAAPVVLTVQSASATVTPPSSSSLCRANDALVPVPSAGYLPSPGTGTYAPDPDAWLRTEVQIYQLKVDNVLVAGQYIRTLAGTAGGKYWRIDTTPIQASQYTIGGVNIVEVPVTNGIRRGLVQVDGSNNMVGFAWQTDVTGQRITKSCWSSFK